MGDLNFRLDDLSKEEVEAAVAREDYQSLLEYDQVMYNTLGYGFLALLDCVSRANAVAQASVIHP